MFYFIMNFLLTALYLYIIHFYDKDRNKQNEIIEALFVMSLGSFFAIPFLMLIGFLHMTNIIMESKDEQ